MKFKLSLPGLVVAGVILIYEVYKKAKEVRENNTQNNSDDYLKREDD